MPISEMHLNSNDKPQIGSIGSKMAGFLMTSGTEEDSPVKPKAKRQCSRPSLHVRYAALK